MWSERPRQGRKHCVPARKVCDGAVLDADVDGDVDVVHVVSGDVDVDVDSDVGGDVKIVRTPSVKWRLNN